MNRNYLSKAAVALATVALLAPVGAGANKRLLPDGTVAKTAQKAPKSENQSLMIANLNKMVERFRLGGQGLGPGGARELPVSPAVERPVNYLSTRSVEAPRGTAYTIVPSHSNAAGYGNALCGTIDFNTGKFNRLYSGSVYSFGEDYYWLTSCIVDGIMYIPAYTQNMVTQEIKSMWRRVDMATGQRLADLSFGDDITGFCYALTYNPEKDKFYGLSVNLVSGVFGELYEYDITSGSPVKKYLGNLAAKADAPGYTCSLTYCPVDGNLYTIKDTGSMYIVEQKENPSLIKVAEFANDPNSDEQYAIPESDLPAPLCYSPKDRAFVTIYRNPYNRTMDVVLIDFDDYFVVRGKSIDLLGYFSSLNCTDSYAPDNAPAQAVLESVKSEKSALNGTLTYVAPSEVFDGTQISSQTLVMKTFVDDKEIDSRVVTAGQKVEIPFTTTEGMHNFSIQPQFGEGDDAVKGPESAHKVWIGNDEPVAPANVKLDGNKLTWEAVGAVGEHAGYVDTDAVTYDVWFDRKKQNAEPIKGTEYTFDDPDGLARYSITVTATANGQTSPASAAVSHVLGKALQLPVSITPTEEQSKLFTEINVDNDQYYFKYFPAKNDYAPCMGIEITQYTDKPNDWLVLPKMNFPSKEYLYQLAFDYSNFYTTSDKIMSSFKVYIGKEPTAEAMTQLIYEREPGNITSPLNIEALFSVPEPGEYYIGIYTGLAVENQSRGVRLWNFNVQGLENVNASMPGGVEDVVIRPAAKGELAVEADFTFPTKSINGEPLDPNTEVTVIGSYEMEEETSVTGKPGEKGHLKVVTNMDQYCFIDLTTALNGVKTIKRTYRAYVGVDVPAKPRNVKGIPTADNMSLLLTWDAPEYGVNGGWIDPENLSYTIFTHSGATSTTIDKTTETQYLFTPASEKQAAYFVGPAAVTKQGTSVLNDFVYEFIGKPHEVPMIEEFTQVTTAGFTYGPWKYATEGQMEGCPWQHVTDLTGINIGDPIAQAGAFIMSSLEGGRTGQLNGPKATTTGLHNVLVGFRYWDYSEAAAMEVYGRRHGHEEMEKLFTITPERNMNISEAKWVDWEQELPKEYQDCSWIQLFVRATVTGANNSVCVLDNFKIFQNVDHDFRVMEATGPSSAYTGEIVKFTVTASNAGLLQGNSNLIVKLEGDGTQLMRQDFPMRRIPAGRSGTFEVKFEMIPDYLKYKEVKLVAQIDDPEDEVALNNEKTHAIKLVKNQFPIVETITGGWNDDHNVPYIDWETPALEYGSIEGFEYELPFQIGDEIGEWKNVDMDGLPQFVIEGLRWENDELPSGWQIFNAKDLNALENPRFYPMSGNQYIIARSVGFNTDNNEEPTQSADWLISPEIVGGTDVTFWYNTGDSQYKETVEVWYTTGDTTLGDKIEKNGNDYTCGAWKRLSVYTKNGTETWEECVAHLPENAKHFAFVYRSWGQFCGMLDEIVYTPAQLSKWDIDHYDVWSRTNNDWETHKQVAKGLKENHFEDTAVGDTNVGYFVVAKVNHNGRIIEGPRSAEYKLDSSSVNELGANAGIAGGKGEIVAVALTGKTLSIYNTEGKYLRHVTIESDRQSIGIDAGVYVVKCGSKIVKVIVK